MAGWSRSAREWVKAMNQFVLMYPDRFNPQAA
jgi:transposase-like protein